MKPTNLCLSLLISTICFSQQVFRGISTEVTVSGRGTRGTWAMASQEGTITTEMTLNKNWVPGSFRNVSFTIPVESLRSDNFTTANAYHSLNTKKFTAVTFVSDSCTVIDNGAACPGKLTVAGKTIMITLHALVRQLGPRVQLSGTQVLKLSDFLEKTPSYMFNTVIPNDEVKISFDAILEEARRPIIEVKKPRSTTKYRIDQPMEN